MSDNFLKTIFLMLRMDIGTIEAVSGGLYSSRISIGMTEEMHEKLLRHLTNDVGVFFLEDLKTHGETLMGFPVVITRDVPGCKLWVMRETLLPEEGEEDEPESDH